MKQNEYRLIDLFCGAGGMTLRFTRYCRGFVPIFANEIEESAAKTYNANFGPHCSVKDIVSLLQTNAVFYPWLIQE